MSRNCLLYKLRKLALLASGAVVLGTSCSHDIQQQLVAAGLQFIKQSASDFLTAALPVNQILTGKQ